MEQQSFIIVLPDFFYNHIFIFKDDIKVQISLKSISCNDSLSLYEVRKGKFILYLLFYKFIIVERCIYCDFDNFICNSQHV